MSGHAYVHQRTDLSQELRKATASAAGVSMHQYHVIDTMQADRSIAFHDTAGVYHVARSVGALPNIGDTLKGAPPRPGAAVLEGRHGLLFDVIFDLVGVRQERAFDRLHGPVTP